MGRDHSLSVDGATPITDRSEILKRWAEHFNDVLNIHELEARSNIAETAQAIKKLTRGKTASSDAIATEIYKHGGINLTKRLVLLFTIMWDSRSVTQDFKDASLVHIYKRKGDRAICDNHRGISLLCIASKILARIMLNRLAHHIADNVLPESQCGFRAGRGTTDMIFGMRQIQEKCREQNQELYMFFIELTKDFDSVNRTGLWKLLAKVGCPDTFVDVIRSFHDDMIARVQCQNRDGANAVLNYICHHAPKSFPR